MTAVRRALFVVVVAVIAMAIGFAMSRLFYAPHPRPDARVVDLDDLPPVDAPPPTAVPGNGATLLPPPTLAPAPTIPPRPAPTDPTPARPDDDSDDSDDSDDGDDDVGELDD